ncbi:MAG: ABC transporter permease [Defluviitaleaceae bacterium]|nr:ABC transporter permease [Defluviitaleaceae bacterium]
MKNLKNVVSFEFFLVAKTKTFLITCATLALFSVIIALLPNIISFVENRNTYSEQARNIIIFDETNSFTNDILSTNINANFTRVTSTEDLINNVENNNYNLGINFITPTSAILFFENNLAGPIYHEEIRNIMLSKYVDNTYGSVGIEILNTNVDIGFVPIGGGFWVGYFLNLAIFFILNYFAASIGHSIANEKSTKIVELLFVSVKPKEIVLGKVISSALLMLVNVSVIVLPFLIASNFSGNTAVNLFSDLNLSSVLSATTIIYLVLYSVFAFFGFLFFYATFAATASDATEVNTVLSTPSMVLMASFFIAMFGVSINPDWMTPFLLDIIGFIPIIAPLPMIVRISSLVTSDTYILISILANFIYTVLIAIFSIKLYSKFIIHSGKIGLKKFLMK